MAFTRVNRIVLHHQVLGRADGPTLVFINSLGSDFRIWQEVVPDFADRFRVVLYDKRGHGLSDAPAAPYTIDDHTDDLIALLDHLKIDKAAFVGLSVGGMIAQRLAVRSPKRVQALALCCTAAKIGTPDLWAERIAGVENSGIEPLADNVLQRWFTPLFRETHPDEVAGWRNMLVRTPAHGYAGTCAAIRDADLRSDAGRIGVPTLCVAGDQDGSTPADVVKGTADLIPGAGFALIEGAGHIPCVEKPSVLSALINRHLQEAGLV
ncbi:3-oxoadipate enol-lactonase [Microvirga lotononidis]|uniref:3-oxoadipate enol-lactonase n=1 Tax=Microvirga lotononidis TaxID=864069 RepID=I4Z0N2_9HYPH|nr:3-oxoadipate enol-lactonase [Microvirga lotononidis]EIM29774.1 3-oxoadipate enol-lactonase [Microvirga lotononidis]WQO26927.1 3-oxoadipate enol-lactonase [Microvirga lotononidis]